MQVQDNGNPLVDLKARFPELSFDQTRKFVQQESKSISFGRLQVGEALVQAQKKLPSGCRFLVKECFRPLSIQKKFWDEYFIYLKRKFPDLTESQIEVECSKYVAPFDVAPHSTGGAVDLLLTDREGNWLDMGSEFNADPSACEDRTYFDASNISDGALQNRMILKEALENVGFVNYPTEWWHWSYGDKYRAFMRNEPHAVFASVEDIN